MIATALHAQETACLVKHAAGKRVLEIGSEFGYSTVVMGQVADSLVSVDWHRMGVGHEAEREMPRKPNPIEHTLPSLLNNLHDHGLIDKVTVIVATSRMALPQLRDGSFSMAFIDGDHTAEGCYYDLVQCHRLLGEEGVLAVHDIGYELEEPFGMGPTLALDRFITGHSWVVVDEAVSLRVLRRWEPE